MSLLKVFVLGIVQGLTEFLPISSTAHLRVVPAVMGWDDPGAQFSAVIQLGSVIAVLTYFWRDLVLLATGSIKAIKERNLNNNNLKLTSAILIGTLPVCFFGLLLKPLLEETNGPFRSLYVIGIAAIVMGLLLLVAEYIGKRQRTIDNIGIIDGLLVGFGQALALIPGSSRSGSTLMVSLLINLKRQDAARFSFLLGIPAIILSGLLELKELLGNGLTEQATLNLIVGLITSTAVSYLSIAWLLRYLQNHSTWIFIAYRLLFGITVLIAALQGRIH